MTTKEKVKSEFIKEMVLKARKVVNEERKNLIFWLEDIVEETDDFRVIEICREKQKRLANLMSYPQENIDIKK